MSKKRLSRTTTPPPSWVYDDSKFREVLLKELPTLTTKNVGNLEVTQHEADKYYSDFHGLLLTKHIKPHLWWLVTVMNGYNCSTDFEGLSVPIITPDIEYLEKLIDIHLTVHR